MAQPTLTMITITPQQAAWEANVNTNFTTLKAAFEDNPIIVAEFALETNLPTVGDNDSTFAFVISETGENVRANGPYANDGPGNAWRNVVWMDKYVEGVLMIEMNAETVAKFRRYGNTVGFQSMMEWLLNDDANAEQIYARAGGEIRVNTATSEEGDFVVEVVQAGSLTEVLRLKGSDLSIIAQGPVQLKSYTVAGLPATVTAGLIAYASDGRKNGEGGGSGTGVQVFADGSNWIAVDTGQTVAA